MPAAMLIDDSLRGEAEFGKVKTSTDHEHRISTNVPILVKQDVKETENSSADAAKSSADKSTIANKKTKNGTRDSKLVDKVIQSVHRFASPLANSKYQPAETHNEEIEKSAVDEAVTDQLMLTEDVKTANAVNGDADNTIAEEDLDEDGSDTVEDIPRDASDTKKSAVRKIQRLTSMVASKITPAVKTTTTADAETGLTQDLLDNADNEAHFETTSKDRTLSSTTSSQFSSISALKAAASSNRLCTMIAAPFGWRPKGVLDKFRPFSLACFCSIIALLLLLVLTAVSLFPPKSWRIVEEQGSRSWNLPVLNGGVATFIQEAAGGSDLRANEDGISTHEQLDQFVETHTSCGPIRGLVETVDMSDADNMWISFTGVPYALPPIGDKRWTHSSSISTKSDCYNGTFEAFARSSKTNDTKSVVSRRQRIRCWSDDIQDGEVYGEDCLKLDIFTSSINYDDLRPVVVVVDDGRGPRSDIGMTSQHSVVIVSVEVRRSVLGFMSLDSLSRKSFTRSSGNYGFGDLISALDWIELNILQFGGHPGQITVLGNGHGSTLALALTASPRTHGSFSRIWATDVDYDIGERIVTSKQASTLYESVATKVGCPAKKASGAQLTCLRKVDASLLVEAAAGEMSYSEMLVIDRHLLFDQLQTYWRRNRFSLIKPLVIGFSRHHVEEDLKKVLNISTVEYLRNKRNDDDEAVRKLDRISLDQLGVPLDVNHADRSPDDTLWTSLVRSVTDIRYQCPLLTGLLGEATKLFTAPVKLYVSNIDNWNAVQGLSSINDDSESKLVEDAFYNFVHGNLPGFERQGLEVSANRVGMLDLSVDSASFAEMDELQTKCQQI